MKKKVLLGSFALIIISIASIVICLFANGVFSDSFYKSIITPNVFEKKIEDEKEYSFKINGLTFYYINVMQSENKILFKKNGKIYTKTNYYVRGLNFISECEFDIYFYAIEDENMKLHLIPREDGYTYYPGQMAEPIDDFFKSYTVGIVIENISNHDVYVDKFVSYK